MAKLKYRLPENTPGTYYVDDTCVDCDMCRSDAPALFGRSEESGLSFVHHQPATGEELAAAEESRLNCPTDSIGNDG